MLHLVRHGRPLVDRSVPAGRWDLDPDGYGEVWELRASGLLPTSGSWFSSPEPKALQTAQLLTDGEIGVLDALREHRRDTTAWHEDHRALVGRALADPEAPAAPGWEPLVRCRDRVVTAVTTLLDEHPDAPLVLVGHATAWTVLLEALTAVPATLEAWDRWTLPDVRVIPR